MTEIIRSPILPAMPGQRRAGVLTSLTDLGGDVVEAAVTLNRPLAHRPGQSVSVVFDGLPAREMAPTLRFEAATELNEVVFHLPRLAGDRLGERIALGHLVRLRGPIGEGYRPGGGGRLVLVATPSGFAAIWAIARAARCIEPARPVVVLVGARTSGDLYMRPALDWLGGAGAQVLSTCSRGAPGSGERFGRVTDHLPRLDDRDAVHAIGHHAMVAAVSRLADAAGASFHGPLPPVAAEPRQSCAVIPLAPRRARSAQARRGAA